MQLRDEADIVASARINGNNRFRADLEVLSRPDEARVNGSGGLPALFAIERRLQGKLNQRNQVIERQVQADILHLLLQVDKAVIQSEAVLQDVGMAFNLEFRLTCFLVDTECARACACGNRNTDDAGDRQRAKQRQALRQIAQALA